MRVKMTPNLAEANQAEGGISTIVRAYYKHMPQFGVEYTDNDDLADLFAIHAGMREEVPGDRPMVAHLHGLYWTADYAATRWEHEANAHVINSLRVADAVTVPSNWVAQSIRRDMHLNPMVIGHGIDLEDWSPGVDEGYVLWNKNRDSDVCDPTPVNELAKRFPRRLFMATYAAKAPTPNIRVTGVMPHDQMKTALAGANIYLATTKETFGIGTLEAMAVGLPILGFNYGGTAELVKHKENGYLAKPGDFDDLAEGMAYCMRYRSRLSAASLEMVKSYSWGNIIWEMAQVYKGLLVPQNTVSVIIPCYNYGDKLERAVKSVLNQTYPIDEIIIVDNNSTDSTKTVGEGLAKTYKNVTYYNCPDQGVAHARNFGIRRTNSTYICCLDADDTIEPEFIRVCVESLQKDATVGVAYTSLMVVTQDNTPHISSWPDEYDFRLFMDGKNQVPTCCVFRKKLWSRLGGYRQRYAPTGQGAEDAEFFLRMGAIGYKGVKATKAALFNYHLGGRTQSGSYVEEDWRKDKPWITDKRYPFATVTPAIRDSHPVRQYDSPLISVVIPVSSNHEKYLVDALDSVEAQTFRRWEVIVAFDGFWPDEVVTNAYPFVKFVRTDKQAGAGVARNEGARHASGPLLLFLDADDWLEPQALQAMLQAFQENQAVIYADYYGHAIIDVDEAKRMDAEGALVEYYQSTGVATFRRQATPYDRNRALRQPDVDQNDWYIWSLISSLVPKNIHDKLGGFDETMASWEDWDYWLRIARSGYGFYHLTQPLVHYRYVTGTRRSVGEANFEPLTKYLLQKYGRGNHV